MTQSAPTQQHTPDISADMDELLAGLMKQQKTISPKFFYDETGSKLFDAICELPEYYPTKTELGIMKTNIEEIASLVGPRASLIEYGSGSSLKTRVLLKNLQDLAVYVPVDISHEHLSRTAHQINLEFPHIEVLPVTANFTLPFQLPNPSVMPLRNIVYFPGSTIGNFNTEDALSLMKVMHLEAGENGALLIGVDLQKSPDILEAAYNDSQGVTAQFNLNVLHRLNREFGSNFKPDQFLHRAIYNATAGRIEMYLDSQTDQTLELGGKIFHFSEGESILTEHSHKYTVEGFAAMAETAGFHVDRVWTDPQQLFSVQYCRRI